MQKNDLVAVAKYVKIGSRAFDENVERSALFGLLVAHEPLDSTLQTFVEAH